MSVQEAESMIDYSVIRPISIKENDPHRPDVENWLGSLDKLQLQTIYWTTRNAATKAKKSRDMEQLYGFVRATKTIQRIADHQGLIISSKREG